MDPVVVSIMTLVAMVFVIQSIAARATRHKRDADRVRADWGKPPRRKSPWNDSSRYYDLKVETERCWSVDDRTWADLYMQEVFARVDHTRSRIGSQTLYDLMRTPTFDQDDIARRDHLIRMFQSDAKLRERAQIALEALNSEDAALLPNLIFLPVPDRPPYFFLFPLLSLSVLAAIVATLINHQLWPIFVPLLMINIFMTQLYRHNMHNWTQPLRVLNTLVRTAATLNRLAEMRKDDELNAVMAPYREQAAAARVLERLTRWLMIERNSSSSDVGAIVVEYFNMALLLDVNSFMFSMEAVRSRRALIRMLFETVGMVDALIAVTSYRLGVATYCVPAFVPAARRMLIQEALHPILPEGAPNSLSIDGRGIFVTGSNMSGKTTFIRTVAANALMAQTIATCTARTYEAPMLDVKTSIGRSDSLQEGKSYYMSEVETMGGFLQDAAEEETCLFVIDEIFRGTNTTERVAASKAVLDALNRPDRPHLVMVSTHDLELANLLQSPWDRYHFREYVQEEELRFDFRLRPGLSSTRNALRLLAARNYPPEVVADAEATAARLEFDALPSTD